IRDVIDLIKKTEHDGFPVIENGKLVGYISTYDMVLCNPNERVSNVMSTNLLVAHPDMELNDAARVIFRTGRSKLPVIDDDRNLIGIITNSDVLRSQIERAHPRKVWKLKKALETIHHVDLHMKRDSVPIENLFPTQSKIYADELEGRMYELKKGLAEPIIVIRKPSKTVLVDGHHRVIAARKLGIKTMDAYVLEMKEDIELGMEKNAKAAGLHSLDDIEILDYAKHPLIEVTERLLKR
ncbi:MAG: CBS domain-containing protein, partial [Candidatus Syntropharchaeia archaeon]